MQIDLNPLLAHVQRHCDGFELEDGIYRPHRFPYHRDQEYNELGFDVLLRMQRHHFWYRGRHRLLLEVLRRTMGKANSQDRPTSAIDLGGGCGGWIEFLHSNDPALLPKLALGDSSLRALSLAGDVVAPFAARFQVDLLDLPWADTWDVVFLLDVLEHIPEHVEVLRQIRKTLRPGGLLFVTAPALQFFWTYNDQLAHHQRRYSKTDLKCLASMVDLDLLRADYFMFFLSPLLLLSRLLQRPAKAASLEEQNEHLERTHRIPPAIINGALTSIFSFEAPLLDRIAFPWGTSILGVFQRPL